MSGNDITSTNNSNNGGGGAGPCGACKFLRRKCVKGCIFAPYFDSEQGTAHFAAVHRVFGASNASKLLLRIPANKRLDAVVSLCYEALSRVRDPVYGCVAHIFTLQQQVINLQAELAYVQARLAILQRLPLQQPPQPQSPNSLITNNIRSSPELANSNSSPSMHLQPCLLGHGQASVESTTSFCDNNNNNASGEGHEGLEYDDELEMLAREFVASYFPAVKFR